MFIAKSVENFMRKHVDGLFEQRWMALDAATLSDLPTTSGVYVLAYSEKKLLGQKVSPGAVIYVGVTNKLDGIQGRVRQFWNSIEGRPQHSGGNSFLSDCAEGQKYSARISQDDKRLYISYVTFDCERRKNFRTGDDLRTMGMVLGLELFVIAHIKDCTDKEPLLNRK